MNIKITYDSSIVNAPAGFESAINYVVNLYDTLFSNPVTINIVVGYGEVPNNSNPFPSNAVGANNQNYVTADYAQILSALDDTATASGDPLQKQAAAVVPTTDPNSGGNYAVTSAEAKALNLNLTSPEPAASAIDGWVGFAATDTYSFTPNIAAGPSNYYFIGVAEHEFSEVMGRVSFPYGNVLPQGSAAIMDLWRYSAPGVETQHFVSNKKPPVPANPAWATATAYFSLDQGATNFGGGLFNNIYFPKSLTNYDLADWNATEPVPNDAYGAGTIGAIAALSSEDVALMNVIGWDTSAILSGQTQYVLPGQTNSGTYVWSGGNLFVDSGGAAVDTVYEGGTGTIFGLETGASIIPGGTEFIFAGGVANNTQISNGGQQDVTDSGTANDAVVLYGGVQIVYSGGVASNTDVALGAGQVISFGGSAISALIEGGGVQQVQSGGIALGTTLGRGQQSVASGGESLQTVIDSAGLALAGGLSLFTTVEGGGEEDVIAGITRFTTLSGGIQRVDAGVASNTRISSGGEQDVYADASATIVSNGGIERVFGGDTDATLLSGGTQIVTSTTVGGSFIPHALSTTIIGGEQVIRYAAIASAASVASGGEQIISSGGGANTTILSSGGQQVISLGGVASAATIDNGGLQIVSSGGRAWTTLVSSGGQQVVSSGGNASASTINSGGLQTVASGALASATTVDDGGTELVYGDDNATTVAGGGSQDVVYGLAVNTVVSGEASIVYPGKPETFFTPASQVVGGGTTGGTMLEDGGTQIVETGPLGGVGTATGTNVDSGSTQSVGAGGSANSTVVFGSGEQDILSGGSATATTVSSGGAAFLSSGGSASGAIVLSGGTEYVDVDAVDRGASVLGTQFVSGVAFDATISSGGQQNVITGTASGTRLRGGHVDVFAGGALAGTTTIYGGSLELQAGAAVGGPIAFSGGGELVIDGATLPTATISGFAVGDQIDLVGVSFSSASQATILSGNKLQIATAGSDYLLQLATGTDYSGTLFSLFSDPEDGTGIVVGPAPVSSTIIVSAGQTLAGAQIVAGGSVTVLPGGVASGLVVDSGGRVIVSSGGEVDGTTVNDGGSQIIEAGGTANGTILEDPGLQIVSAGATAIGTILNGGRQDVYGTASAALIGSAGHQVILSGGTALSTTIRNGGEQDVDGGTAGFTIISAGGTEQLNVGTDSGTTISSGGVEQIYLSGTAIGATVSSGGEQDVDNGVASRTVVAGGGVLMVEAYGTASGTTVSGTAASLATENVYGSETDATIEARGVQIVNNGATVVGATLSSGGEQVIDGGSVSLTMISAGGDQELNVGVDSSATIEAGGFQNIYNGGTAVDATVRSGGEQTVETGATSGTRVTGGGVLTVATAGSARSSIVSGNVSSLATENVDGSDNDTTIKARGIQIVNIGGMVVGATLSSGGEQVVDGGSDSFTIISSGGDQELNVGVDSGTTIDAGGIENVYNGGTAVNATVLSGGDQAVYTGAASATNVDGGGKLTVAIAGTASGTFVSGNISSPATENLYGSDTSAVIEARGIQFVNVGGTAISATLSSGGQQVINGGSASFTLISSGGGQELNAGVDSGATIAAGGVQNVYAGGTAVSAMVSSGGNQGLYTGAASGTDVAAGGVLTVGAGGTAFSATLGGGTANVSGTAIGAIIDSGGLAVVFAGGLDSGTTVNVGGVEQISAGGMATDTSVYGGYDPTPGEQIVYGTASGTTVGPGGYQSVASGGTALQATVYGDQDIAGAASGTTIESGGVAFVDANGVAVGATVQSGGVLEVQSGGDLRGVTTISGGTVELDPLVAVDGTFRFTGMGTLDDGSFPHLANTISGFASGDVVDLQQVTLGPLGVTLAAGNVLVIDEADAAGDDVTLDFDPSQSLAGETFEATADAAGGTDITLAVTATVTVPAGQTTEGAQVGSGGEQDVYGVADDTTVDSGGKQDVDAIVNGYGEAFPGVASGTIVEAGGEQDVEPNGIALAAQVYGVQNVNSGGTASGTMVEAGGAQYIFEDYTLAGTAVDTTIGSGGKQYVGAFTTASGTTVDSGGNEYVEAYAVASGTVVEAGGAVHVSNNAQDINAVVSGTLYLSGVASGTNVDSGGSEVLYYGGAEHGASVAGFQDDFGAEFAATIRSGGVQFVEAGGGLASGTTILAGGTQKVAGLVDGEVIEGGTVEMLSGAGYEGNFVFAGAGKLIIDSGALADSLLQISGFAGGDVLDLANVSFDPSDEAIIDPTTKWLEIEKNGDPLFPVILLPAATYADATFTLFNDGNGGTAVVLGTVISPGQVGSGLQVTAGEDLNVGVGSTVSGISISSGGAVYVSSGGNADGTTVNDGGVQIVLSGGVATATGLNDPGLEIVSAGGSSISASVSGGEQDVYGVASSTTIYNSGLAIVFSGGVASGTNVDSGGKSLVSSGGALEGDTTVSGGILELQAGAAVDGPVILVGATVQLDGITSPGVDIGATGPDALATVSASIDPADAYEVADGAELLLNAAPNAASNYVFDASAPGGTFAFSTPGSAVEGLVTGVAVGDSIALPGTSVTSVIFDAYSMSITTDVGTTNFENVDYTGVTPTSFSAAPDEAGLERVTFGTACYCAGTHILTDKGEVAVEDLRMGDRLVTRAGTLRPLCWIGRRGYVDPFLRANPEIWPIVIRAGAIADHVPRRDLRVSPLHAMYLDGILIPARNLVNDASIVCVAPGAEVTYFHLELDTHDILLAEGAAAESYVDLGNRAMFQNVHEYVPLARSCATWPPDEFAPRLERGPTVDAVRSRLAARAEASGLAMPKTYSLHLTATGLTQIILPADTTELRLLSDVGYAHGDQRQLGALISGIRIDHGALPLDDRHRLRGFHDVERHGENLVRWTAGEAIVAFTPSTATRSVEVVVATVMACAAQRNRKVA